MLFCCSINVVILWYKCCFTTRSQRRSRLKKQTSIYTLVTNCIIDIARKHAAIVANVCSGVLLVRSLRVRADRCGNDGSSASETSCWKWTSSGNAGLGMYTKLSVMLAWRVNFSGLKTLIGEWQQWEISNASEQNVTKLGNSLWIQGL